MKKTRIRLSLFSLVLALVLFGLTIRLTGRDPLVVYWSILTGSFGSTKSFLNVLAYMLPLIMTGLGAAVAFQSGVFNIGSEIDYIYLQKKRAYGRDNFRQQRYYPVCNGYPDCGIPPEMLGH